MGVESALDPCSGAHSPPTIRLGRHGELLRDPTVPQLSQSGWGRGFHSGADVYRKPSVCCHPRSHPLFSRRCGAGAAGLKAGEEHGVPTRGVGIPGTMGMVCSPPWAVGRGGRSHGKGGMGWMGTGTTRSSPMGPLAGGEGRREGGRQGGLWGRGGHSAVG